MNESRNQRLRRARPVLALAAVAFVLGAIFGARHTASPARALAEQFAAAWTRHDYLSMYSDISESSRRSTSVSEFAGAYQHAITAATATHLKVTGKARVAAGGNVTVPVRVDTRLFGMLMLDFNMRVIDDPSGDPRVVWSPSLAFPGLRPGEALSSDISLPQRATVLARDGSVLTASSPQGESPPGLELALDERLRGIAGGELLAGRRLLAYAKPRAAPSVRTTISPTLQRAAVTALGGQYGGVIAMRPATGEILAVAGIGLDGLQPPGSTFKIVTTTGVLAAKIATAHTVFPYATYATLDGVKLNNANGEDCGGSLELAFAVSCNSVFTPLGVKLGAGRLVATAERYGFNHEPGIAGAPESTLPAAGDIQGELDIGSTAIGQGQVLATPLEMAIVAATVADGGRRPAPSFLPGKATSGVTVMSSSVARTLRRLMIGVVREGTGTAAAIPGVTVAGKTGTAELKTACKSSAAPETSSSEAREATKEGCQQSAESEAANTDAWFAAFAPALHPRIVVCVLLVKDGAGGATAAPVAREVIEAGLAAER